MKNVRYYKHYRKPRSGLNGFLNAIICHWLPSSVYNNNASLAVPWWAKRYECPSPAPYPRYIIIIVFYPVGRYYFIFIWARIIIRGGVERRTWDGTNPEYIFFVLFSRAGEFEKWYAADLLRKYSTSACVIYTRNGPCFMRMHTLPLHARTCIYASYGVVRMTRSLFHTIAFLKMFSLRDDFESLQNNVNYLKQYVIIFCSY